MRAAAPSRRCLLISQHATIVGGGEISLLTLLKGLGATAWEPVLIVPRDGPVAAGARELGVTVRFAAMPPLRRPGVAMLQAVRRLRALVRELAPTIVHANGSRAMFYAGLGARATRCPAIWHVRILDADPALDWLLVRLADASIAPSEAARERLRPWPQAWERCQVIPNGLDLAGFTAERAGSTVRAELGVAENDLMAVMVSRLVDFKRHEVLLGAVAALRAEIPTLRCVVVGTGPEEDRLRDIAARHDLGDTVVFAGHREDVADILAAADVFVLTSPVESFGRVVIEAMALRVPVVAAAAGGPAEIIEDGESGILVAPGDAAALADAIGALSADLELRERIGSAGRRRVEERYSMASHTRDVVAFYEHLVDCGHRLERTCAS